MILQVRHAMGGHPYTVPNDAKVTEAARMMITVGTNTIIVTRDHEILGSVTVNDILRHTYKPGFNPDEETIGSITDEEGRTLEAELSFLDEGREYEAFIYADARGANWKDRPYMIDIRKERVDSSTILKLELAPGGGQAIRISPVKGSSE